MRTNKLNIMRLFIAFIILSTLNSIFVFADDPGSHFRYGTLSWAPTGNPGEVDFRLKAAFRRDSNWGPVNIGAIITETQGPTRFNFGDNSSTNTLQFIIIAHSVSENWVIGEMLDPVTGNVGLLHTYSGSGPFTAFLAGFSGGDACCRIGQAGFGTTPPLANRAGGDYPLETIVFPESDNSSPVSTMVPVVVVQEGSPATFFVPAADPDGDPIRWRLSTDAEAGGGSHPPGLNVNPSTGEVFWNNVGLDQTAFWTTQIVIEDLDANGNVKTKTPVDFLLRIVPPPPPEFPECTINPAGPLMVAVGSLVSFTVNGTDADQGDVVELNSGGLPAGAIMTPSLPIIGPFSGVSSTFSWTPTATQAGTYVVIFSATDQTGRQGLCSIVIVVITEITVVFDIKPQSCPNPFRVTDKGVLPVAILGTDDFDVNDIDLSTLDLAGVAPLRNSIEDVSTPVVNRQDECDCTIEGADGFDDLTLKFNAQTIIAALGPVNDGDEVFLTITGNLKDGTPIVGKDCVIIKAKGFRKSGAKSEVSVLENYALFQNYPNPFNPETRISYALPLESSVSLKVYDISGRVVSTLVNKTQSAGVYQVTFNATNLTSGIYFYALQAGSFSQINRMLIIK